MTYTFKLARRISRFRAPLTAVLLAALTACDNADSLGPQGSDTERGAADPLSSASFAGGIPFGTFAQPNSAFGDLFNGAMQNNGPMHLMDALAEIRARGGKVVMMMAGSELHYKDGSGHFSFTKWKERIDRFKGLNFTSYINDGTIVGHYLIDEPHDKFNWSGREIPGTTLEEMAKYSKQLWPGMPTIVRVEPEYLRGWSNYKYLDAAWAQYTARRGSASEYLRENVEHSQKLGLALIVGLNLIDGGNPNLSPMSASEVESYGTALLNSSFPCAFLSWQYNESYLNGSGMKSAMATLRRLAQNRNTKTCRGASSSGGQAPPPPPPSEPPPSEPPPQEPPPSEEPPPVSPSAGVPFGAYGLPNSQLGTFSSSVRNATPSNVLATARDARQAGARVILRLTGGSNVTNGDGSFNLTKWKAALDRYAGVNIASYVGDGTIAAHMLVENAQDASAWGGKVIPHATIEEMARYSRQRWPQLPTVVDAAPAWLAGKSGSWQYLDAAAVTYAGSAGSAETWVRRQASDAARARLGLMVGMNVLNGGTSSSGLAGTTRGKYAMSASQLRSWGSTLVAESRVCGLLMARYQSSYFGRSDVKSAMADVARAARTRAGTSCRVRA
jgi:hypothetical protein